MGDIGDAPPAPAPGSDPAGPYQPAGLRLLTPAQYQASIRDLLGDDNPIQAVGQWRSSIAAAQGGVSLTAVEEYEEAALEAAAFVFADAGRRDALVGCEPEASATDPCVLEFVEAFGRRAWRRPITAEESERYATLIQTLGALFSDPWRGFEYAVVGMLQSPSFLYRVELGEPDPAAPERLRFSSHDMATRLSYFVWNTTPDAALLDAADEGALVQDAALVEQLDRLVASERARAGSSQFFSDLLDLESLLHVQKDATWVPLYTDTIGPAMREQLLLTIDAVALGDDSDYRDLFVSRSTFVNAELANLYELPGSFGSELEAVTLPEDGPRAGHPLPGRAPHHVLGRGRHFADAAREVRRNVLLCQVIPPPPPGVTATLPETKPDEPVTTRDLLEQHRNDPSCAACHKFMDPIGLSLENFDALGGFRATQNGLDIDASGDLDGDVFVDAKGLGEAMREHPALAECLIRSVYRYGTGHIEQGVELATIDALTQRFAADGHRVRSAFELVALSESFRRAAVPAGVGEGDELKRRASRWSLGRRTFLRGVLGSAGVMIPRLPALRGDAERAVPPWRAARRRRSVSASGSGGTGPDPAAGTRRRSGPGWAASEIPPRARLGEGLRNIVSGGSGDGFHLGDAAQKNPHVEGAVAILSGGNPPLTPPIPARATTGTT